MGRVDIDLLNESKRKTKDKHIEIYDLFKFGNSRYEKGHGHFYEGLFLQSLLILDNLYKTFPTLN